MKKQESVLFLNGRTEDLESLIQRMMMTGKLKSRFVRISRVYRHIHVTIYLLVRYGDQEYHGVYRIFGTDEGLVCSQEKTPFTFGPFDIETVERLFSGSEVLFRKNGTIYTVVLGKKPSIRK